MHRLEIKYKQAFHYEILIEQGLFSSLDLLIRHKVPSENYFLITVPPVKKHYLKPLTEQFLSAGLKLHATVLADGERSKCQASITDIMEFLSMHRANRNSVLIALGGGVVGDITGFAASIYMRGIRYVQIPTSLIAQVDSSIGGKTGINSSHGKNLVGSFYQPSLVLIDPVILSTLPEEEYRNGLTEAVKYGLLKKRIFTFLEKNVDAIKSRNSDCLSQLINYCCVHKAKIVSLDLLDKNIRASLNLGHTVGHALEKITGYTYYKHGEAIAWGMLAAASLSKQRKLITHSSFERIITMLHSYSLLKPLQRFTSRTLIHAMHLDKKKTTGLLSFILQEGIGKVKMYHDVTEEEIRSALRFLRSF